MGGQGSGECLGWAVRRKGSSQVVAEAVGGGWKSGWERVLSVAKRLAGCWGMGRGGGVWQERLGNSLGAAPSRLRGYAGGYFGVYVHVRLLRRGSSTPEQGAWPWTLLGLGRARGIGLGVTELVEPVLVL